MAPVSAAPLRHRLNATTIKKAIETSPFSFFAHSALLFRAINTSSSNQSRNALLGSELFPPKRTLARVKRPVNRHGLDVQRFTTNCLPWLDVAWLELSAACYRKPECQDAVYIFSADGHRLALASILAAAQYALHSLIPFSRWEKASEWSLACLTNNY